MEEVKHDLAERQFRWQQIENMCSFSIISNPGIGALIQSTGHTDIYKNCHGGMIIKFRVTARETIETLQYKAAAIAATL